MVKLKISLNGIVILPSLLMGIRLRHEGVQADPRMRERYVQAVQYENAVGRSERPASFEHKPGSEYDRLESIAEWKRWCTDEIAAVEESWEFAKLKQFWRDQDFLSESCPGAFLAYCQSITRGILKSASKLTSEDVKQIIPEISGRQGIVDLIVSFAPQLKVLEIPLYNEMVTWITKLIAHAYYISQLFPRQRPDKNWRVTRIRAALNTSFRAISGDSCHPRHHIRIRPDGFGCDSLDRIDPDSRHSIVCIEVPFRNEATRRHDWLTLVCDIRAV